MLNEKQRGQRDPLEKSVRDLWNFLSRHSTDTKPCEGDIACPGWVVAEVAKPWKWEIQRCDHCNPNAEDLKVVRDLERTLHELGIGNRLNLKALLYPASI